MDDKEFETLLKKDIDKITPSKNFNMVKNQILASKLTKEIDKPKKKFSFFNIKILTPIALGVAAIGVATPLIINSITSETLYCDASVEISIEDDSTSSLYARVEINNDVVTNDTIYGLDDNAKDVLNELGNNYQSSFNNLLLELENNTSESVTKYVDLFAKNEAELEKISSICEENGYVINSSIVIKKEYYHYIEKATRVHDYAKRLYRNDGRFDMNDISISNIMEEAKEGRIDLNELSHSFSSFNEFLPNDEVISRFNKDHDGELPPPPPPMGEEGNREEPTIRIMEDLFKEKKRERELGPKEDNYFAS